MKKFSSLFKPIMLLALLAALVSSSALAQTFSVSLDDHIYTFTGGAGTYQVDGKTFIIAEDCVTVQEAGKADITLTFETTEDHSVTKEDVQAAKEYVQYSVESTDSDMISQPDAASLETNCAQEGEMSAAEKQAFFDAYADFGLTYDAQSDAIFYLGQRVRCFTDIRQSNGEELNSGLFCGSITSFNCDEEGTLDVETIRDFAQPDANGDGKLIGLRAETVQSAQ